MTSSRLFARPVALAFTAVLLLSTVGCDRFENPTTPPLRLTSEVSEAGWNYATDGEVTAACPVTWTLEQVHRPNRAWRCRHHAATGVDATGQTTIRVGGCGLTVYRAHGANTLEELRERIQPEIEGYGSAAELISSGPAELGGLDAYELEMTQRMDGEAVHAWYRMTRRGDLAWLGHCIVPVEFVEEDREVVEAIFDRISL
jgi:hypothetical protein